MLMVCVCYVDACMCDVDVCDDVRRTVFRIRVSHDVGDVRHGAAAHWVIVRACVSDVYVIGLQTTR